MNNKKERKIAIVVIIVLVAIIAFVIISKTALKPGITCGQADEFNRSVCLSEAARMTNDSSYCAKIADHNLLYACRDKLWQVDQCTYAILVHKDCDDFLISQSIVNKNVTSCLRIVSEAKRQDCLFGMANLSINEGKNYCEICAKGRAYNLSGFAVVTNDTSRYNYTEKTMCSSAGCFAVYASRTNNPEKACSLFENNKDCFN